MSSLWVITKAPMLRVLRPHEFCHTISRFFDASNSGEGDPGPPILFTKEYPDGLPESMVDPEHHRELRNAKELLARTRAIVVAAHRSPDRSLSSNYRFLEVNRPGRIPSIWCNPDDFLAHNDRQPQERQPLEAAAKEAVKAARATPAVATTAVATPTAATAL